MIGFSPVICEGLSAILTKDPAIEVSGVAADASAALRQLRQAASDRRPINTALTETRNANINGVEVTRLIKESYPTTAVLVLTEHHNDAHVIDAIHAGADGLMFLKDMSASVLLESIHRVAEDGHANEDEPAACGGGCVTPERP